METLREYQRVKHNFPVFSCFPNNSLNHNLNFYVTNYGYERGMKDLYDQKRPVFSLGSWGMSCVRKLISFSRSHKRYLHGASWCGQWQRVGTEKVPS